MFKFTSDSLPERHAVKAKRLGVMMMNSTPQICAFKKKVSFRFVDFKFVVMIFFWLSASL